MLTVNTDLLWSGMVVSRVIKRSSNSILLTLIIALYLPRAFSCESTTTTLDWCKSNLNTDGFLNDFGEGKRSICEFNERILDMQEAKQFGILWNYYL